MVDVINTFITLLDKYGLGVAQMGLTIFLFYKLYANHLTHIQRDIKDTKSSVEQTNQKIEILDKKTDELGERVAKIEGRFDALKPRRRK